MEKWIAPRALALLAVISILIIGGGVLAYFIHKDDLNRVERLERVVQCQHSPECRRFVERAIREILRHAKQSADGKLKVSNDGRGSLRLVPRDGGGVVIVPAPGSVPAPPKEPNAPSPSKPPQGKDTPKSTKGSEPSPARTQSPSQRAGEPEPKQELPPESQPPPPISVAPEGLLPTLPEKVKEAIGNVVDPICTTIKELNGICETEE